MGYPTGCGRSFFEGRPAWRGGRSIAGASQNQLLGEVVAQPTGALDRPAALWPLLGPGQQPGGGLGAGEDGALADGLLVLVNGDGDMAGLVGVDADDDWQRLL